MDDIPSIIAHDHASYMRFALSLANRAEPKPTNFRVGAALVNETKNEILATGFTLELPGNTHAEQCCLSKYASQHRVSELDAGNVLPDGTVLYTTMEPCNKRASGNMPCTERILQTKLGNCPGIQKVYHGVKEPETFVGENGGRARLEEAGVRCIHVPGFEDEILRTATAGHVKDGSRN